MSLREVPSLSICYVPYTRHFLWFSLSLTTPSQRKQGISSLFYYWIIWRSAARNLPKVTQLDSGRASIWTQVCVTPKSTPNHHIINCEPTLSHRILDTHSLPVTAAPQRGSTSLLKAFAVTSGATTILVDCWHLHWECLLLKSLLVLSLNEAYLGSPAGDALHTLTFPLPLTLNVILGEPPLRNTQCLFGPKTIVSDYMSPFSRC